jgi:hypothetical protein
VTLQVPANRLHLVSVDRQGVARLKLRPRYEPAAERGIVRIDAAPMYDGPPTVEDLYRAAAKNHELETAYYAQRTAERAKRRDSDRERREQLAETFLADREQRAIPHPPPSTKRCYLVTDQGRVLFDVATDEGIAKDVPAEAHRRFRADLRARQERNRQERTAQLALHEEKKRFIADWIAANGTEEQRARQAAGVLPMEEAIEAITGHVFAALAEQPQYERDGLGRLQAQLRRFSSTGSAPITSEDIVVRSEHAKTATAEQWSKVNTFRALLPGADVHLRVHRVSLKNSASIQPIVQHGVLVTMKHGPFTLRREYSLNLARQFEAAAAS